jgi:hypothetical protein
MSITESNASRVKAMEGRLAFLDTGSGFAKIRLYDGTRPLVSADPDVGSTLIAEVALTKPAGSIVSNALTLTASGAGDVLQTGTPTWARAVNGDGATAFDTDAGIVGSGAECIISDEVLYAGGVVTIVNVAFS